MKNYKFGSVLLLSLLFSISVNAQFDPFPPNTVDCGFVCSPDCDDSDGGGNDDPFCELLGTCDPGDCDPTIQSCIGDDDDGGGCTGADCGDTDPCGGGTANGSSNTPNGATGNPINLISGNKYKNQVDLEPLPGVLGLEFSRHYNSAYSRSIGLGVGWRHSYSTILSVRKGFAPGEMDTLRLQQADGRILFFKRVGERKIGSQYQTKNHIDGYITTTEFGYQWRWRDGKTISFDDRGLMTQIAKHSQILTLRYSSSGQLLRVTDPQGRRLSLHYNGRRLAGFTDPSGAATQYKYDREERLVNVVRPSGKIRIYHYQDKTHHWNLTGITDERGIRTQSYGYDEKGRAIVSTKDIGTEKVTIEYDDENNRRILTDETGVQTEYILTEVAGQRVISEVRGPGCAVCQEGNVAYQYNSSLQVTKITRKNGLISDFEYDQRGRLVKEFRSSPTQDRELVKSYKYNGSTIRPSEIGTPSIKSGALVNIALEYDDNQRLKSGVAQGFVLQADGEYLPTSRRVDFGYDSFGRLTQVSNPGLDSNNSTQIEWTENSLIRSISSADGVEQEILEYTELGQIKRMKIGEHPPFSFKYDVSGNLIDAAMDGWQTSDIRFQMSYDASNNLTRLVGPAGAEANYEYDSQNRLVKKQTADHTVAYSWSESNAMLSRRISDLRGESVEFRSYKYDDQRRLVGVYNEQGRQLEARELTGEMYSVTTRGAIDRTREYQFDDFGELHKLVNENTVSQFIQVNGSPRIEGFTDSTGGQTRFGYDDFGLISYVDSPDSGLTQYLRDNHGRVTQKIDALGSKAAFEYSGISQIKEIGLADTTINVARKDNEIHTNNSTGSETRKYENGALRSIVRHINVSPDESQSKSVEKIFETSFEYDKDRLVSQGLPGGERLNFIYHEDGRLSSISLDGVLFDDVIIEGIKLESSPSDGKSGLIHNEIQLAFGNGTATEIHSDRLRNGRSFLRELSHTGDGIQDQKLSYLYNNQSQIIGIDKGKKPFHRYRFDKDQALTFAMTPHALYGYSYDENNNRLVTAINGKNIHQTYEEGSNRISSMKAGEVDIPTSYREDGSIERLGSLRFEYNNNGQPSSVYDASSSKLLARYYYNSRAERNVKIVYAQDGSEDHRTYFMYENNRLAAEVHSKGNVVRNYVYAGTRLVAIIENGDVYTVHSNHLGAPILVANDAGGAVWEATYAPFGQAIVNSDPDKDSHLFELNLRLPGQYEDRETRLHYNYYRYYEPITGRYISSDPLGLDAGPNTFAYVKNDPVHYTDPLGLLLFAFDGTGNEAQSGPSASNVVHFRNAYSSDPGEMATGSGHGYGGAENAYYISGAGTYDPTSDYDPPGLNAADAAAGGSMVPRAEIMFDYFLGYLELMQENQHWAGADAHTLNIDTTGFSRGAATARLFANAIDAFIRDDFSTFNDLARIPAYVPVVDTAGFNDRIDSIRTYLDCNNISVNLRFLGLFDSVSHYGLDSQDNDLQQLPLGIPSSADYVAHAVAANENRADFQGISIHNSAATGNSSNRVELGFVGAHSDIGGGYGEGDLSDVALNWVTQQAQAAGLNINLAADQREVSNPIVHSSEGVFPFINSDRDFQYANGSQSDQAGNTAPNDSLLELLNPQPTWSANGAYGLNAEDIVGMFDQSLMETFLVCSGLFCTEEQRKGLDAGGSRTLIGEVDADQYRQLLSQPPYNLNITFQ